MSSGAISDDLFVLQVPGAQTVAANKVRVYIPFDIQLVAVGMAVGTAPTGAALIVDLKKNGTSVFSNPANRPQIAAGATKSFAVDQALNVDFEADTVLTLDVAQIGSTVAGSDLTVTIQYTADTD